jgi:hypothetical protein
MSLSKKNLSGLGSIGGLADAEHSIFITIMAAAINNHIFNNKKYDKWIATSETRIERNLKIPNDNSSINLEKKLIRVPDIIVWNRGKLDEGAIEIPELFIEIERSDSRNLKIEKAKTLFKEFPYWKEGFVMIYDSEPIEFIKFTHQKIYYQNEVKDSTAYSDILKYDLAIRFKKYWNDAFK